MEEIVSRGAIAFGGGMELALSITVEREPVAKVMFAGNWNSLRQVQGSQK